ncbi:hypothetical protein E4U44_008593, partial [Claviceps purpurea]
MSINNDDTSVVRCQQRAFEQHNILRRLNTYDSDDESGLGEEFEDSDDEFGLGEDSSRREPDTGPENQDDDDLSALRDRVGGGLLPNATPDLPQPSAQPYLSIRGRTAADTPLDEWATDGGLLSLTFPSLYPY